MAGTTRANWQQYSRWGWVIARTMRINQPNLTKNVYDYEIVALATGKFVIEGNHVLEFKTGDVFSVKNSTGNNGNYTVASDATYDEPTNRTTVTATVAAPDATVDGEVVVAEMEETVVRRFVRFFWNTATHTGSRPWLDWKFVGDGTQGATYNPGDCAREPVHVLVKLLQHTVRDLKKTPLTEAERPLVDALFAGTGNRRFGDMGNLV